MSMTTHGYNYDLAIREVGDQVTVTNNLGRTAIYGEIVNLSGMYGIVMEHDGIANGATGRIYVLQPDTLISTAQINKTDTFTAGQPIYFKAGGSSAAGTLEDSASGSAVAIGTIESAVGDAGAHTSVSFRPYSQVVDYDGYDDRLTAVETAIEDSAVKVARVVIDATDDYSATGKEVSIPKGAIILDVVAVATATKAGGTAQVFNGASAVHTAIDMDTDGAVTRMEAGVDDTKLLVGDDAITVKTNASGDAGIVSIYYI
jgi:hypothetical protein